MRNGGRGRTLRAGRTFVGLLLAPFLAGVLSAQQADVNRELEEAKKLYREAKFVQAVAKLQEALGKLERLQDMQARKTRLADAYLHLGLAHIGMNDPLTGRHMFKEALRVDRSLVLDPEIYAPKVIDLFEQAKAEVAQEPALPVALGPPGPPKKKAWWKLPVIGLSTLGVGAAQVLANVRGGTSFPNPEPGPSSVESAFLGTDPPSGTTLSVTRGPLQILISLRYDFRGSRVGCIRVNLGPDRSNSQRACFPDSFPNNVRNTGVGPNATIMSLSLRDLTSDCRPPVTLTALFVSFFEVPTAAGGSSCAVPGAVVSQAAYDVLFRIEP